MNIDIVQDFVKAINSANITKICDLITQDHLFIDSQDNRLAGKENMKLAWLEYFTLFPDYKIEVNKIFETDSEICAFGHASATYLNMKNKDNSNFWRIPAAWRATMRDKQICVWQVYADNSVVLEIVKKNQANLFDATL